MNIINSKYMDIAARKGEFFGATPFPHIVLDDFLDEQFFSSLKSSLEKITDTTLGVKFDTAIEEKKWISINSTLPDAVQQIVNTLSSDIWVKNMQRLTGISSLRSTPIGNTLLANYHVMEPGGILGPHVDHSFEPGTGVPHVLNNIIYLTENWNVNLGGSTLFYDQKGKEVMAKVECKPNRAVLFLHTPYSFHSVDRISADTELKRRTIYVDFYSESYDPFKGMRLKFDSSWFKHGTTFKFANFLDYFKFRNRYYTYALLQYHLNRLKSKIPAYFTRK